MAKPQLGWVRSCSYTFYSLIYFIMTLSGCTKSEPLAQQKWLKAERQTIDVSHTGFGGKTKGGQDGEVIEVTNLADSGPGSLRAACESNYPRIVVFRVAGTIELDKVLRISHPFITIAGQTAPGQGITVKGSLIVQTSEVIIRGIRVRVGSKKAKDLDGIAILSPVDSAVSNVIIDHCTISWSIDENIAANGKKSAISNITVSNSIIAEGLNDPELHSKNHGHSAGILLFNNVSQVSIINNLFAHNNFRQPKIGDGVSAEVINNVIYNWKRKATTIGPGSIVDIVGNFYKPGPDWSEKFSGITFEDHQPGKEANVYLSGNLQFGSNQRDSEIISGTDTWIVGKPYFNRNYQPVPAEDAFKDVINNVGPKVRDRHDLRIIDDVLQGTGGLIHLEKDVGGFLYREVEMGVDDSDGDGMPDHWEAKYQLDAADPSDAKFDRNGDGLSNLDEYLNSFFTN